MFRRLFLPLIGIVLPLLAAVAACSVNADTALDDATGGDAGEPPPIPTEATSDDGATRQAPSVAIGLCQLGPYNCSPDDDGSQAPERGRASCTPNVDAGPKATNSADASTVTTACRVSSDKTAPTCVAADTRGVDGVYCQAGTECAPGFECVQGEKGGVCRRYCCAGTCAGFTSQNGGPTFCDPQTRLPTGDGTITPVCMPVKTCTLLEDGDCGPKETCAIVDDKGATGCVAGGNQGVGAPCDQAHCTAGLTCLGSPGDRQCYKLCRTTEGSDCTAPDTCTTSAAFQDTSYGVCKASE